MARHRELLFRTRFDAEDLLMLAEAAECGDADVLRHAARCGVAFSTFVLDRAVLAFASGECVDIISKAVTCAGISGHLVEWLARDDPALLQSLAERSLISPAGLRRLRDLAEVRLG